MTPIRPKKPDGSTYFLEFSEDDDSVEEYTPPVNNYCTDPDYVPKVLKRRCHREMEDPDQAFNVGDPVYAPFPGRKPYLECE